MPDFCDVVVSGMKDLPWVERGAACCLGESGPLVTSATMGANVFSAVHRELEVDKLSARCMHSLLARLAF